MSSDQVRPPEAGGEPYHQQRAIPATARAVVVDRRQHRAQILHRERSLRAPRGRADPPRQAGQDLAHVGRGRRGEARRQMPSSDRTHAPANRRHGPAAIGKSHQVQRQGLTRRRQRALAGRRAPPLKIAPVMRVRGARILRAPRQSQRRPLHPQNPQVETTALE
jgi:hypothetical protein